MFSLQLLSASSWLHVKVRLLIKSFSLIYIMRHWKICLNLRDPMGPSPPTPSPRFVKVAQFNFLISCVRECLRVTSWLCFISGDPGTQQGLCVAPWNRSTAVSAWIGRNLLLRLSCFAEQWFALISLIWIPISATLAQLWRTSLAFPRLLHMQKKKKKPCSENASETLNKTAEIQLCSRKNKTF